MMNNCECNFKEEYEKYLEEERCRLEEEEKNIPQLKPDEINPYILNNSRDKLYMGYAGSDRFTWFEHIIKKPK